MKYRGLWAFFKGDDESGHGFVEDALIVVAVLLGGLLLLSVFHG